MRTNKFLIFFLFLFLNLWIWKIFFEDFLIFSILIVITVASYKKFITDRKKSLVLVQLLMILLTVITQYLTTSISSLTELTNDQIRIRDMRLREYPPVFIRLGAKTLWLPVGGKARIDCYRAYSGKYFRILRYKSILFRIPPASKSRGKGV